MQKLEIKFFFFLKNTKPSLSPLSSHFGILAKGRGGSATEVFNGRGGVPDNRYRSSMEASHNHVPTSESRVQVTSHQSHF
jgi:hypothetical protein